VRRGVLATAVATQIANAEVVGQDEDDVGRRGRERRAGGEEGEEQRV